MNIKSYLDSTYLKTPEQAGITIAEDKKIVQEAIQEAISEDFKLIMIRPNHVASAKKMITDAKSKLSIGTVIDFPKGSATLEEKIHEAQQAIADGADDLDFVCDYEAFKKGEKNLLKNEILICTKLGLENNKIVKWIIEIAALDDIQIIQLCVLIKNIVISNFKEELYSHVFVKSSTGFYQTQNNLPNGATIPAIQMMLENAYPLSVKAAGGVRNFEEAQAMIQLGVKRIGTSSALEIAKHQDSKNNY